MKKFLLMLSVVYVAMVTLSLARPGWATSTVVRGYLMDVACATKESNRNTVALAAHDRPCLLTDTCVNSGYSIVTADMKVLRFDVRGNQEASRLLLANRPNDWRVIATGAVGKDTMAVTRLTLQ